MRHRIAGALAALIAFVAILAGMATPASAQSAGTIAAAVTAPTAVDYIDDPMINGKKFATSAICVGSLLNQTTYPAWAAAQQWNVQSGSGGVRLDGSTSCTTDGYGPSARMVVGTFSNPAEGCLYFTNQQTAIYNGYNRWTNGPGVYLNTSSNFGNCVDTLAHREHWLSEGIGYLLGLINFDSSGWNSHVMNGTAYSLDNVPWATPSEGDKVWAIYNGLFCDVGSVC